MDFGSIITFITANYDVLVQVALQVIGVASLVARLVPGEADNKVVDAVLRVVNFLALSKKPTA